MSIFGIIIGITTIYVSLALRWVQKPFKWIIEYNFFGTTAAHVWESGLHFLPLPIKPFMYVRNKVDTAQKAVTLHIGLKDGAGRPDPIDFSDTTAGALVQVVYKVVNPIAATYTVQDEDLKVNALTETGEAVSLVFRGYERATLNRIEAELRRFFGGLSFNEANSDSKKAEIRRAVIDSSKVDVSTWGVEIIDISIIDFVLDKETAAIRQGRLKAETEAAMAITAAEGQKQARITTAEGEGQAITIVAEAEAKAREQAGLGEQKRLKLVADAGLNPEKAAAYLIATGANEAFAKGNATIIATSEGGNMNFPATLAGIAKGMFGEKGTPNPASPAPESGQQQAQTANPQSAPEHASGSSKPLSARRRNT